MRGVGSVAAQEMESGRPEHGKKGGQEKREKQEPDAQAEADPQILEFWYLGGGEPGAGSQIMDPIDVPDPILVDGPVIDSDGIAILERAFDREAGKLYRNVTYYFALRTHLREADLQGLRPTRIGPPLHVPGDALHRAR